MDLQALRQQNCARSVILTGGGKLFFEARTVPQAGTIEAGVHGSRSGERTLSSRAPFSRGTGVGIQAVAGVAGNCEV